MLRASLCLCACLRLQMEVSEQLNVCFDEISALAHGSGPQWPTVGTTSSQADTLQESSFDHFNQHTDYTLLLLCCSSIIVSSDQGGGADVVCMAVNLSRSL